VDAIREELQRVCQSTPLWTGKVCVLQVTDCKEQTIQLRALMDARNSSEAFDLRCLVREKLIDFLHRNHPQSLPRLRGAFDLPAAERTNDSVMPGSESNGPHGGLRTGAATGRNVYSSE
jgi:hypothetical protein